MSEGLQACGIGYHCMSFNDSPCVDLDLSLPWAQNCVLDLIRCPKSAAIVFISPPCGTFSRARNRPKHQGVRDTQKLRSERYVRGVPEAFASEASAKKLRLDNGLADFALEVITECRNIGRLWFCSGPASSFLWWKIGEDLSGTM